MRTNIDIDDELMAATLEESGRTTKKAAVEEAMRHYVKVRRQLRALEALKGIGWEGDLGDMRRDREFAEDGTVIHPDE